MWRSIASFDVVRQLRAGRGEELDAVVVERIVRRADDDAGRQPQRTRQVGDRGRRQRSGQIDVDAGRRQAGLQRRLEQVARDARVLADQHARRLALARAFTRGEHASGRVAELQHQLGRDRRLADASANAVGAEITSGSHPLPCSVNARIVASRIARRRAIGPSARSTRPRRSTARQTASASTVSRTSCTRNSNAPRATAASIAARLAARRSSGVATRQLAERGLARQSGEHRIAGIDQRGQRVQQLQVVVYVFRRSRSPDRARCDRLRCRRLRRRALAKRGNARTSATTSS